MKKYEVGDMAIEGFSGGTFTIRHQPSAAVMYDIRGLTKTELVDLWLAIGKTLDRTKIASLAVSDGCFLSEVNADPTWTKKQMMAVKANIRSMAQSLQSNWERNRQAR